MVQKPAPGLPKDNLLRRTDLIQSGNFNGARSRASSGSAIDQSKISLRRRRFDKDEQTLKEMARRHVSYEVKMLRELADALQGKGVGPRTMRNALLESFLIHYRNLYDFFYPDFPGRRRLPHDVCVRDYLRDTKRWRKHRPECDSKFRENRERVNVLLAHLTLRRLKYNSRSWHDKKMAAMIEALLQEFLHELPRDRRAWFRSVVAKKPPSRP